MQVLPITRYSSGCYNKRAERYNSTSFKSKGSTASNEIKQTLCNDTSYKALISTLKASAFGKINEWEKPFRNYMIKIDELVSAAAETVVPQRVEFPSCRYFNSEMFNGIYQIRKNDNGTTISVRDLENKTLYRQIFIPYDNILPMPNDTLGITVTDFEFIPEINDFIRKDSVTFCNDGSQIIKKNDFFYNYGKHPEEKEAYYYVETPKSKLSVIYDSEGYIHKKLYYNKHGLLIKTTSNNYERYYKNGILYCITDNNNNVYDQKGYKIFQL